VIVWTCGIVDGHCHGSARAEGLSTIAALEHLVRIEVDAVEARILGTRMRTVCLPEPWALTDFDFSAQPHVDEAPSATGPLALWNAVPRCRRSA
jgi:hypothetical protein